MGKLPIPVSILVGAPLTDEELKEIIGGYTHTTTCSCSYTTNAGVHGDCSLSASTASECQTGCASVCLAVSCVASNFDFKEHVSG